MPLPLDDTIARNELASDWMHRGIDLMNGNEPARLEQAVRCFDEAIALRRTLPLTEEARYPYGLAAGWMNRGDALARLGGKEQLAESVKSYDEALGLLLDLPLGDDPLYPRRLAIAWINRGFARQKQESLEARKEAVRCFREALVILEDAVSAAIADLNLLRAGALINLAGALLEGPDAAGTEAREAAQKALLLIKDEERSQTMAAETGFKARHLLCRSIAAESVDGKSIPPRLIAEAIDAVEEGLVLARHWEQQGESGFRELAEDLFRFGCRIYQTSQPHFLTEFILENLDPKTTGGISPLNREMHDAAVAALWSAVKEIQREGFQSLSTPRFGQVLENLRELRVTEERLEELRRAGPTALDR
jgi:tetratricopeptide (TPR) repeat protein